MSAENIFALKTVSGAIHYILCRYNENEISPRDWVYLCNYLEIDLKTIYCIEVTGTGFVLTTKKVSMRYVHSDFHEKRIVELNG